MACYHLNLLHSLLQLDELLQNLICPVSANHLSVYSAPITAKATSVPLVSYNLENASPAKVPELYYQSKRQERELQRDGVVIKDCFSHTRILRRAVTDHPS